MKSIFIMFAALGIEVPGISIADSLPLNPGMWESTVTSTNSMIGTTTKTTKECIVEDEFDPKSMVDEAQGCEIVESNLSGNTLTFTMVCKVEDGQGTMQGAYQSDGDTGQGAMNMEFSFGGQTMTMDFSMTARRVGDC